MLSVVFEDVSTEQGTRAEEHQEANLDGGGAEIAQQLVAVDRAEARCSLELHDHLILYKKIGAEVSNTNSAIPDVNRCLFDDAESAIAEFVSKRASIDVFRKAGAEDIIYRPESSNHDGCDVAAEQLRVSGVLWSNWIAHPRSLRSQADHFIIISTRGGVIPARARACPRSVRGSSLRITSTHTAGRPADTTRVYGRCDAAKLRGGASHDGTRCGCPVRGSVGGTRRARDTNVGSSDA